MRNTVERQHVLSPRARRIGLLVFVSLVVILGVRAISWAVPKVWTQGNTITGSLVAAEPLHMWSSGETLQATDLNGNFSNLQLQISGQVIRKITRAHGNGPNDTTGSGAITTRRLQYIKSQDTSGLRIVWSDNLRCLGANEASCEWEIKIDGVSCAMPGPLTFDVYSYVGGPSLNIHRPQAVVATCFGIAKGQHTVQVYVTAPASIPVGGAGVGGAGAPWTGWNAAYWSIEVEEVY